MTSQVEVKDSFTSALWKLVVQASLVGSDQLTAEVKPQAQSEQ